MVNNGHIGLGGGRGWLVELAWDEGAGYVSITDWFSARYTLVSRENWSRDSIYNTRKELSCASNVCHITYSFLFSFTF